MSAMAEYRRRSDDAIVHAERWSSIDNTSGDVRTMLAEVDDRLAAVQVRWPEAERLLLIRVPPSTFFPRGSYTVVRDQDWIVAGTDGKDVWVEGFANQEFSQSFEMLDP